MPKILINRTETLSNYSNGPMRSHISEMASDSDDRKSLFPKTFNVRDEDKFIQIAER